MLIVMYYLVARYRLTFMCSEPHSSQILQPAPSLLGIHSRDEMELKKLKGIDQLPLTRP